MPNSSMTSPLIVRRHWMFMCLLGMRPAFRRDDTRFHWHYILMKDFATCYSTFPLTITREGVARIGAPSALSKR